MAKVMDIVDMKKLILEPSVVVNASAIPKVDVEEITPEEEVAPEIHLSVDKNIIDNVNRPAVQVGQLWNVGDINPDVGYNTVIILAYDPVAQLALVAKIYQHMNPSANNVEIATDENTPQIKGVVNCLRINYKPYHALVEKVGSVMEDCYDEILSKISNSFKISPKKEKMLTDSLNNEKSKVSELEIKLSASKIASGVVTRYKHDNDRLKLELADVRRREEVASEKAESLQDQVNRLKSSVDHDLEIEKRYNELLEDHETVNKKLRSTRNAYNQYKRRVETKLEKYNEMKKEMKEMKKAEIKVAENNASNEKELENLRKEIEKLKEENMNLKLEKVKLEGKLELMMEMYKAK